MQKVLLAVDGIKPTEKAFRYAVELCQRLCAELRVVQVIRPERYNEYLKKIRKGAQRAKRYIENSMMAATFAEAGEHEMSKEIMALAKMNIKRLLPESERAGVSCHLTMASGRPGKEIIRYVNERETVTICNSPEACFDIPWHIKLLVDVTKMPGLLQSATAR